MGGGEGTELAPRTTAAPAPQQDSRGRRKRQRLTGSRVSFLLSLWAVTVGTCSGVGIRNQDVLILPHLPSPQVAPGGSWMSLLGRPPGCLMEACAGKHVGPSPGGSGSSEDKTVPRGRLGVLAKTILAASSVF